MREIEDCRKKASQYELSAHLMGCLALFLFKTESRNGYNQKRDDQQFRDNYEKLFKQPMPHADSIHNVMELLDDSQVERLKYTLIKVLLARKLFHKSRYRNKWFRIAVDASGCACFEHKHCEQCLHQTSKTGKTTYFHNVLEARLITPNGFSISILTQWIENPENEEYDKQDCERKAFNRLAIRLKKAYPKLPIIILADGLYPYEGFFKICQQNKWAYSATFKKGNLATVWEEVDSLLLLQPENRWIEKYYYPADKTIEQFYSWVTDIDYRGYTLHWLECREQVTLLKQDENGKLQAITTQCNFVHITDLPLDKNNIVKASQTGRLRWKIENEGFNTLKNGGYKMEHKYARKSYQAMKNYFQFMQIAHLINQLMIKSLYFQAHYLKGKNHPTLKNIWKNMMSAMEWCELNSKILEDIAKEQRQFRLIS